MNDKRNLEWLVDRRCKIQQFLLKLHHFGVAQHSPSTDIRGAIFELSVGAGFGLWRAVFLIDPERTRPTVPEKAKQFLQVLIADNTIGYPQETRTREWTAGYYLNDAYFRLRLCGDMLSRHSQNPKEERFYMKAVDVYFQDLISRLAVEASLEDSWDAAFDVLQRLVEDLSD